MENSHLNQLSLDELTKMKKRWFNENLDKIKTITRIIEKFGVEKYIACRLVQYISCNIDGNNINALMDKLNGYTAVDVNGKCVLSDLENDSLFIPGQWCERFIETYLQAAIKKEREEEFAINESNRRELIEQLSYEWN